MPDWSTCGAPRRNAAARLRVLRVRHSESAPDPPRRGGPVNRNADGTSDMPRVQKTNKGHPARKEKRKADELSSGPFRRWRRGRRRRRRRRKRALGAAPLHQDLGDHAVAGAAARALPILCPKRSTASIKYGCHQLKDLKDLIPPPPKAYGLLGFVG